MHCKDCNALIPRARLDAVPGTQYCVRCVAAHTPRVVGRMIWPHKTGGELIVAVGTENIRRLNREYGRAR